MELAKLWAWGANLHGLVSLVMTGLIWTVHAVVYPAFRDVTARDWGAYHEAHLRRTGPLVAPLMVLELLTAHCLISEIAVDGSLRWAGLGYQWSAGGNLFWLAWANTWMLWIVTFALFVPLHRKLAEGQDAALIRRLIQWNRVRVLLWTSKSLIVLALP